MLSGWLKPLAIGALFVTSLASARPAGAADIAQQLIDAWSNHDADKVASYFSDNVTYEDVTLGAVMHGPAEVKNFAAKWFTQSPDSKFTVTSSFLEAGHGYCEWVVTGTDEGIFKTGKKFSVRGVSIFDGSQEKITRETDYWDMGTMMKQLGVLPPPGSQHASASQ